MSSDSGKSSSGNASSKTSSNADPSMGTGIESSSLAPANFTNGVQTSFVRTVSFAAAHRYASPLFSEDENRKAYGHLYREEGFGHNFLVEAHFEGEIEPLTGMIINLSDVDAWLKDVAARFDHKHLNEIPELTGVAPTPERLAQKFFELVDEHVRQHQAELVRAGSTRTVSLTKIRVYEGDDTWVDYRGSR